MTAEEFNKKYEKYLEEGHYGLAIDEPHITEYLDRCFQELIIIPGFKYSQIKMKFNSCCFYNTIPHGTLFISLSYKVENYITEYFKWKDIINKIN